MASEPCLKPPCGELIAGFAIEASDHAVLVREIVDFYGFLRGGKGRCDVAGLSETRREAVERSARAFSS
jgi:hypothetical protein